MSDNASLAQHGPTEEYAAGLRARVERVSLGLIGRLPQRLLRRLAGRPVVIDGNTLHPAFQIGLKAMGLQDMQVRLGPTESRADLERSAWVAAGRPIEVGMVRDLTIDGAEGELPARLYLPASAPDDLPVLIYLHGGGWVAGSIASHDNLCRALCADARVAVLSVGYRLAPENPFPAAVEDVVAAYGWLRRTAGSLGLDPDRIAVGGDSAGANLTAVLCQQLRETGTPLPRLQLLLVPAVDLSRRAASYDSVGQGFYLTGADVDWFEEHYLTDPAQARDPRVSPLLADELAGLPEAYIVIAGFDPLRDEGLAYAGRLREAGVPVTSRVYPGMVHPMSNALTVRDARAAVREAAGALAATLMAGKTVPQKRGGSVAGVLLRMPPALGQVRRVSRDTPRLRDAAGRRGVAGAPGGPGGPGGPALRIAVVGDSVAAGVGVDDHEQTMAGRLADEMHRRTGRPVEWEVFAQSGADAAEVATRLGNGIGLRDRYAIIVSVGVNDLKGLRSDRRWRSGLVALLGRITSAAPGAQVLLLPVPPVERFPALAGRLGRLLAPRAHRLTSIARDVVRAYPTVRFLDFPDDALGDPAVSFAADGFHPSAALHAQIAQVAADLLNAPTTD